MNDDLQHALREMSLDQRDELILAALRRGDPAEIDQLHEAHKAALGRDEAFCARLPMIGQAGDEETRRRAEEFCAGWYTTTRSPGDARAHGSALP